MALCRIYKKLIANCPGPSKSLANINTSSVIAQPHAAIEVGQPNMTLPIVFFS